MYYCILVILSVIRFSTVCVDGALVNTPIGLIQGLETSINNQIVHQFLGIPYAKAPVADLRFKKPVPRSVFEDVFDATRFGPVCPQFVSQKIKDAINITGVSEDCLFVNIYVPGTIRKDSGKAVMVWLFGGAYIYGEGDLYDGTALAAKGDVIFISLNHRLGPLGFLSTANNSSRGNYGLWDVRLALIWVQENIAAFGGDPKRVTLFGESSGGCIAGFFTMSKHTTGLFRRVILQSSAATTPSFITHSPMHYAKEFGIRVKCIGQGETTGPGETTPASLMECLRQVSIDDIINATYAMDYDDIAWSLIDFAWLPVVDGDFIPDSPLKLLNNARYLETTDFYNVDTLVGVTNNEGALLYSWRIPDVQQYHPTAQVNVSKLVHERKFYRKKFLPAIFKQLFLSNKNHVLVKTAEFYYRNWTQTNNNYVGFSELFGAFGDSTMVVPVLEHVKQRLRAPTDSPGRTFVYLFAHDPQYRNNSIVKGLGHGEDLLYVFGFTKELRSIFDVNVVTEIDRQLSNTVMIFWTNFAKYGNPNQLEGTDLIPWPEYEAKRQNYFTISSHVGTKSVGSRLFEDRLALWTELFPTLLYDCRESADYTLSDIPTSRDSNVGKSKQNGVNTGCRATAVALGILVVVLLILIFVLLYLYFKMKKLNKFVQHFKKEECENLNQVYYGNTRSSDGSVYT